MALPWVRAGLLAAAVAATLLGWAPAAFGQITFPSAPPAQQPAQPIPLPPPQPARDPRLDQIRQHLQSQGLTVREVVFQAAPPNGRARWVALTDATYAQPSWDRIDRQAYMTWNALYTVLGDREPPTTLYASVQLWTKYAIGMQSQVNHIAALVNALRAARTSQEQHQAYQTFYKTISIYVIDAETGQFVDVKDFINKNFTR